ncbi:MAG: fibronectin type III domain-containing protein [Candidatus Kapabacteria bacterium]|jgi:hypothetical protein|nr:fibronectin type III domain-containing protein [Candidatus Kapabacteria bacterium]
MLKNKLIVLLAGIAMSLFVLSSCSEDNNTNPNPNPEPKPSPASNLEATSINSTTVALKFVVSPSETNTLFQDYMLSWKEESGPAAGDSKVILKGTTKTEVSDLEEGKVYLFTLVARYTNDSVSTPVTVLWSPASRFVLNTNDDDIKVYETSSNFGSGLQMFYDSEGAPRVRTVSNGKDWDLGIRTTDNKIIIGSASKMTYNFPTGQTPDPTLIYKDYFKAASLDDVFDSRAMNDGDRDANYSEVTFDITNFTEATNLVFYVRKYQPGETRYNYAKVMIKRPAGGGSFLQGTSPNRFIQFEISYQKTPDVPYAKISNSNVTN